MISMFEIFEKYGIKITRSKKKCEYYESFRRQPIDLEGLNFTSESVMYETLVEKLFEKIDLTKLNNNVLDDIIKYCDENSIKIKIDDTSKEIPPSGYVEGDTIHIVCNASSDFKKIILVILHEISHFITNRASNDRLKKMMEEPNRSNIDINDIKSISKELNYYLCRGEKANWALSMAIECYFNNIKSAKEIFFNIKKEFENKSKNDNFIYLNLKSFKETPDDIKPLYFICYYYFRVLYLKKIKSEKQVMFKLGTFLELTDRYLTRLKNKFGLKYLGEQKINEDTRKLL